VRRLLLLLPLAALAVSGCRTASYYGQAIKGQCQIFHREKEIADLLADPKTPEPLKARLEVLRGIRAFAENDLHLPVNGHYRAYADLQRPYVVWNVQAAPEFSMQPKSWWYPFLGGLDYRGYFSEHGATNYAAYLRTKGFDTYVDGVSAYSMLGWFKDPALNTFLFEPDTELAETIFHELAHQKLFAAGDTDFNEAWATAVGEEGARRWLKAKGQPSAGKQYEIALQRDREFVHLVMDTRARLETLYGDQLNEGGTPVASQKPREIPIEQLRLQKAQILNQLQEQYASLKNTWGGSTNYDSWFAEGVNNAKLNSVAAYYDLVPGFNEMLVLNGGDLEKFYAAVKRLLKMPKSERHQWLRSLGKH
jgi:predicted aminopeptidase